MRLSLVGGLIGTLIGALRKALIGALIKALIKALIGALSKSLIGLGEGGRGRITWSIRMLRMLTGSFETLVDWLISNEPINTPINEDETKEGLDRASDKGEGGKGCPPPPSPIHLRS